MGRLSVRDESLAVSKLDPAQNGEQSAGPVGALKLDKNEPRRLSGVRGSWLWLDQPEAHTSQVDHQRQAGATVRGSQ